MKLSDVKCRTAQPKEKPYKLTDGHGLYLDVRPNGSKYWRFKYRWHSREKLLAVGIYPEVTLAEARDKRLEARRMLNQGLDPSLQKQKAKMASKIASENTFKAVALEFLEQKKGFVTDRYLATIKTRLAQDVFPHVGNYPITEITPPILLEVIRKTEARQAYEVAKRNLQAAGQIFRYAIQTGRAERDPSADLKGALKPYKKTHFAALSARELPELIDALNANKVRLYPLTINATKLLLLTFVRTSELIEAKWEEIDLDAKEWIIPAERMKMRQAHIVPLSDQAVKILRDIHKESGHRAHVFPNQVRPAKPMSNNTILKALERLGFKGRMTGHGCRALAMSTIKEKLNYRHEVIDRQLAHGHKNSVTAAYDRAQFLPERRKMMQDWADYLNL